MQRHARHVRLDVGDFDMIVGLARALRARRNIGAAMLAGRGNQIALGRRIGMQRPMRAGMRLALVLAGGVLRGLLSLARRQTGIVRRLRRFAQFGFERGDARLLLFDARVQQVNLRQQRVDQLVLRAMVEQT